MIRRVLFPFPVLLVLLAISSCRPAARQDVDPAADNSSPATVSNGEAHEGLLHGRITTDDGTVYEGRLRWGGDEEALWGNYFNGLKGENPWVAQEPLEGLPKVRSSFGLFGIEFVGWDTEMDLRRPFMARFGDISRIEPRGREFRVTLKSGTAFDLDRYAADDLADGVRVWDGRWGEVDIDEWQIRSIELFAVGQPGTGPHPLYGTVRTPVGEFTGLVQWDREECIESDELNGFTADGELALRFDTIRSISRSLGESSLVTLLDGTEIVLSGTREVGPGNRGIYVDDQRYGRVLVSWDAFERVDFSPGGTGPAYVDFPPGRPLHGDVVSRSGNRFAGRLVYDFDESETTETLDAPWQGVDYTLLFGLIDSVVLPGLDEGGAQSARVTLWSGETLELERAGDLGEGNAGILIFSDGSERPEYVPWADVQEIDFAHPSEIFPPSVPR